jgi:hypothetical protein
MTHERALVAGTCYLCAGRIFIGDEIQCWTVVTNPVAAHAKCVEENLASGQAEPEMERDRR